MVIYEAATAICSLSGVTQRELAPAVTVLQLFLCSPKPCLRFAAVRTLNKVAIVHPLAVTPCNMDMEGLSFDGTQHRAIEDARNMAKLFAKVAKPLSIV